jgi:hypothetical protein
MQGRRRNEGLTRQCGGGGRDATVASSEVYAASDLWSFCAISHPTRLLTIDEEKIYEKRNEDTSCLLFDSVFCVPTKSPSLCYSKAPPKLSRRVTQKDCGRRNLHIHHRRDPSADFGAIQNLRLPCPRFDAQSHEDTACIHAADAETQKDSRSLLLPSPPLLPLPPFSFRCLYSLHDLACHRHLPSHHGLVCLCS